MNPTITSLDHLVLTVENLSKTVAFYIDILGMTFEKFQPSDGSQRVALRFGGQKINLHEVGSEFDPKACKPTAGSADLCFLSETPLASWQAHLSERGVELAHQPINRTGATGPIRSIYVRDPDGNLIEISNLI